MRTQSMDTRPEAEQFQIALLRKTPLIKRFRRTADILDAVIPLLQIFEQMDIISYIQGEIAIAVYGMQRGVTHIELVADVQMKHVISLAAKLETIYSFDIGEIRTAVNRRATFSGVHRDALIKLTVFLTKGHPFDQEVLRRVQTHVLVESKPPLTYLQPWTHVIDLPYQQQWTSPLDFTYLQQWATTLEVADLLEKALIDAGIKGE